MKTITFETELNLYKVKSIEWVESHIVALDFNDLHTDLIDAEIEPKCIELLHEVYVTKRVLWNIN